MAAYVLKPEHSLQASVARFFKAHMLPSVAWTSVDHGITFRGSRLQAVREWERLLARGVHKGVHDIPIIFHRGTLLSIELKDVGKEADPDQTAWGTKIISNGGHWRVCDSRASVWKAMCDVFGNDNPLRPPLGALNLWLAQDDIPRPVKPKPKRTKARAEKPDVARVRRVEAIRRRIVF